MKNSKKYIAKLLLLCVVIFVFSTDWREKLLLPQEYPFVDIQSNLNPPDEEVYDEKLWLHRVNEYERMHKASKTYTGMEIDVHYSFIHNSFYTSHDPDPIEYIFLDDLLHSVENIHHFNIWLDVKNLHNDNAEAALQHLMYICDTLKIDPDNIIVESPYPHLLETFKKTGYNTSYYIPTFNPYDASEEEIIDYIEEIDSVLIVNDVDYISGNYKQYQLINHYFPDAHILLWQTHRNLLKPYLRKKLLKDPDVHVLLTN